MQPTPVPNSPSAKQKGREGRHEGGGDRVEALQKGAKDERISFWRGQRFRWQEHDAALEKVRNTLETMKPKI